MYSHVFYHLLELCIHNSFLSESHFVIFRNLTSEGKSYISQNHLPFCEELVEQPIEGCATR